MLKRVEIENYKSLKEFALNFNKFNVLVGPNATGKSNILDCLAFLSESLEILWDLPSIFARRGGFQYIIFQGEREITMKANFSFDHDEHEYYLKCMPDGEVEGRWLKVSGKEIISQYYEETSAVKHSYYKNNSKEDLWVAHRMPWIKLINSIPNDSALRYMSKLHFYSFLTPQIRQTLPVRKDFILESNGSNLAQVLFSLKNERPETFTAIEETMKIAIPEIETLRTPLTDTDPAETYVAVREKGFKDPFDYRQLSDGTLRLLAYITALNLDVELLCFEEPENFVHPQLLRLLVEILKKSNKQVIVSTHSPYFIDHVEPDDLIIVEKEEGKTKVRRIEEESDKNRVKLLLKDGIPLGEVYYSGAI